MMFKRNRRDSNGFWRITKKRGLILAGILGFLFILYQIFSVIIINRDINQAMSHKKTDGHEYIEPEPSDQNMEHHEKVFTCAISREKIPIEYFNDDYCDCSTDGSDASDEPLTNACLNNQFQCRFGYELGHPEKRRIPSDRVNDGICDCCDGSDEWMGLKSTSGLLILQTLAAKHSKIRLSPCSNLC